MLLTIMHASCIRCRTWRWRDLDAVTLLLSAFPLQDPSARLEENEQLLQKQFDIIQVILHPLN